MYEKIDEVKNKLKEISDIRTLFQYKKKFMFGTSQHNLIEKNGEELLKKDLPKISNMFLLIFYWERVSTYSKSEKLIEDRANELLEDVGVTNMLKWFLRIYKQVEKGDRKLPLFMRNNFEKKVKEIKDFL